MWNLSPEGVSVANRYDDAIKALCAVDLTGLCRWLGVPVEGGRAEPIRLSESVPVASVGHR